MTYPFLEVNEIKRTLLYSLLRENETKQIQTIVEFHNFKLYVNTNNWGFLFQDHLIDNIIGNGKSDWKSHCRMESSGSVEVYPLFINL